MTTGFRVLIIEDDAVVSGIYRLILERAGFEVSSATDGNSGLELAQSLHPDVVFLDVRLPKLDGTEVLQRLMEDQATKPIPVVMLSNYDDPPLINSSLALGAKQYLVKVNTDPTDLPAIAHKWIEQKPLPTETGQSRTPSAR